MALALAESLLENGEYLPRDVMQRYVDWMDSGVYSSTGTCFDIGETTQSALDMFKQFRRPEIGSHASCMSGNGSIMRLAPAVTFFLPDVSKAIYMAERQSFTTHGSEECLEACRILGAELAGRIMGSPAVKVNVETGGGTRIRRKDWQHIPRHQIRSTGYVIDALEAALWADGHSSTFEESLVKAVNLGGDADTIGAITGQLAGARYGIEAIPSRWLDVLHDKDRIIETASKLADAQASKKRFFFRSR
jgi:ADP-ribosyl-[dinitrogen reductase] hydrolase